MWWKILKDTKTATRSADLWAMNDYDFYQEILIYIKSAVREGLSKENIIVELAQELPNLMSHMEGFMQELIEMEPSDGIADVDWKEVARNFEEDIDSIIEDLRSEEE